MTVGNAASANPSRRPTDPISLLLHQDIGTLWQARNLKANRFSVLNLDVVIGEIGLDHTTSAPFFQQAKTEILASNWRTLRNFEYGCSHTQIYPPVRNEARRFGHAATAVVAMELAAAKRVPGYDVYDKLRILPATYFVDGFDREQYDLAKAADPNFEENCLKAIGQEFDKGLVYQHCCGMTITKPVAEGVLKFVKLVLPKSTLGPVLCVGDPKQRSASLATKNRATCLTFDPTLAPQDVPPLP